MKYLHTLFFILFYRTTGYNLDIINKTMHVKLNIPYTKTVYNIYIFI